MKVVEGVIAENDTDFYSNQYGPFFTFANGSGSFASGIDNYIIAPYAKGLQQANKDDSSITYTSLATTSKAVSKTHLKSAKKYTKEDGDVEGTFDLGAQNKEECNKRKWKWRKHNYRNQHFGVKFSLYVRWQYEWTCCRRKPWNVQ